MKRKIVTIICILTLTIIECTPPVAKVDLPKRTVISGKIQHLEVYPKTKEIFAEVIDFRDRKSVFKDSINIDGTFHIELTLYAPQDIKMSPVLNEIILHPGDSTFIDLDFKDLSFAHFSGDRSKENEALNKYQWSYQAGGYYTKDRMDIGTYKTYCDSVKTVTFNKRNEFLTKEKPPSEVAIWTENKIKIKYFEAILSYPNFNFRWYNKDAYFEWIDSTNFLKSVESNFADFDGKIINADLYKMIERYESLISTKLSINNSDNKGISVNAIISEILLEHDNNIFRQLVLGQFGYQFLCANYINVFTDFRNVIDKNLSEFFIKQPLFDYYNDLMKNMENPEFSSNAILAKMGIEGKVLLDSIIAENKGKVLFVDLWATWCGPCLEGMKASKEIMPRFENKDIEFIFLCVNSTEENWKTILSRFKIGGKHYFCNNEQSRDIRRALGVEGIPHYIMINKRGYIIESKSLDLAKSLDKIDKLLEEK